jgi:hypothetical protein
VDLWYVALARRDARVDLRHVSAVLVALQEVHRRISIGGGVGVGLVTAKDHDTKEKFLHKRGLDLGLRGRYGIWMGARYRFDFGLRFDYLVSERGDVWSGGFDLIFGRR